MEGAATGSQKNATLPGTGSKAGTARFANFAKDQDLNSAAIYAQLTGGNFQVAVPEATSAPSTPAEESDEGPSTAASSSGSGGRGGRRTRTVTQYVTPTATVMSTVAVAAAAQPTGVAEPSVVPEPSPFMQRRNRIRREAGGWRLGRP